MIPTYTKKLEQIISEMQALSHNEQVVAQDMQVWLEFLKQIYPDSDLLKQITPTKYDQSRIEKTLNYRMQTYVDIREVMVLAESKGYPAWFIQPHLIGLNLVLTYVDGELQQLVFEDADNWEVLPIHELGSIPKVISGYTGHIRGVLHVASQIPSGIPLKDTETIRATIYESYLSGNGKDLLFTAYDVSTNHNFREAMHTLQNYGLHIPDFVLFPTDKIPTVSSSTLQLSLQNYISKARDSGLKVDGLVIASDSPLMSAVGMMSDNRILYCL
jgi:hypothetical protein